MVAAMPSAQTMSFVGPVEATEPDHGTSLHWAIDPTWTPSLDAEVRRYRSNRCLSPEGARWEVRSARQSWSKNLYQPHPAVMFIFEGHRRSTTPADAEKRMDLEDGMPYTWDELASPREQPPRAEHRGPLEYDDALHGESRGDDLADAAHQWPHQQR